MRAALSWAGVLVCLWLALPTQLGGHLGLTVVAGHSMQPTYQAGDLLVTVRGSDYEAGDVLVYVIPAGDVGAGTHVVHRLRGYAEDGSYEMQGDNNAGTDIWHPTAGDAQGRVVASVPGGGVILRWLVSPLALAALCGVLTAVLVAQPRDRPASGGGPPTSPPKDDRSGGDPEPGGSDPAVGDDADDGARRPRPVLFLLGLVVLGCLAALAVPASASTLGGVSPRLLFATSDVTAVGGTPTDVTYTQTLASDTPSGYCAGVTVTNDSGLVVVWEIALDLTRAPFDATAITSSTGVIEVGFSAGSWTVRGVPGNETLEPGASATFSYCATAPPG